MSTEPNRSPRWERRKESRPSELIAAALDLFVERGFAATRLDEVAARAGVSKGTLYLYFSSKEDLFKAVVRETIVPLIQSFREDLESSDATGAAMLRRYFSEWWTHFGATRLSGICKLVIAEAGNFPELARFFQEEVVAPNTALLREIIQRGIDRGEFRRVDLDIATHAWMAPLVLKGIWMHSIAPCCPNLPELDPEDFVAGHAQLVLDCLQPGQSGGLVPATPSGEATR